MMYHYLQCGHEVPIQASEKLSANCKFIFIKYAAPLPCYTYWHHAYWCPTRNKYKIIKRGQDVTQRPSCRCATA